MTMAMASDECSFSRHDYSAKAIAMCATILVIVAAFLHGSRFLRNRRRQRGDLQHQQQHQKFEIKEGSSSSGDSEAAPEYEVFLSFRGSDIRNTFTSHLYYGLTDAGICTFMDNEELRVGEEIGPKLMKSIKQSKIGMPIFSADYASSKWCLMEVAEMVKSMKEEGKQLIMPIFYNVSVDDVQHQTGSYANSFTKHEKRFGREKVEEWRYALREVVKLKGLELAKMANGDEGVFIKYVVARVIRELKKSYLEMASILVGIEDRVEELVNKLQVGMDDVRFLGIWGMGGIGKTTLAKYVYNQVMDKFECHSFLKDIRETTKRQGLQSLQTKLCADILRRDKEDHFDVEAGVSVLKERLRGKKALVLLDDVDHVDQLKALAADVSWFGRGSRIIITTREKNVLDLSHVKDLYPVESLTKDLSFELFCMHAFGDRSPRPDLAEEAREIVNITGGLPLALEVTGSSLSNYVGKKSVWQDTIEKLKEKPDMKVHDKLKISFESLERQQREIFLDIACFFIGMDVRMVTPMWNDAKFFPIVGIEILQLKSLIKIGDDHTIWMHDQLRDLGRSIVDDMDDEPGRRTRIWRNKDAFSVLVGEQGTNKVKAICLEGYQEEVHLSDIMFSKMQNLRILELGRARLGGNFHRLLHELKWLSWHRESIYLPEHLVLKNLIALDLSWSLIDESWIGWSMIKFGSKLKVLNLSNCSMRKTPDFSWFPSLEILIMEYCVALECIDESIGLLKNLILLNLKGCRGLRKLPEQLDSMESLTELFIDGTRVEELPISGGVKKLEIISADECGDLREVPASIGSLTNLKKISLRGCRNLSELPESIGKLTSLVELDLTGCCSLKRLPDFHRDMHYCLEKLILELTEIDGLPGNLGSLKKLKVLKVLKAWKNEWVECIEIPDDVSNLSSLRELELSHIKRLPGSLSALSCLETFELKFSHNLPALPKLPSCLVKLIIEIFSSKRAGGFPNLESLVNLKELTLWGDFEVKEGCLDHMCKLEKLDLWKVKIRSLPEHISSFPRLKELYIDFCEELGRVPTLPPSLSSFSFGECGSFEKLPDLSNLKQLSSISINCPDVPEEIPGLKEYLTFSTITRVDGTRLLDGTRRLDGSG